MVEANVVYVNHKNHMVDPFVVHVFFVDCMNHKKHMVEANMVYVIHKKHMVDPIVVHVFFVVYMNHKKHMVEAKVVYAFFGISHKPPKTM